MTYSNVVFSGAILVWVFNSLANVIRGTGNMAVPAVVTSVGAAALIPLSPCLIFGWGPFPRLGIAGGAGGRAPHVAARGQHDAASHRRRWWLAGTHMEWRRHVCLRRA
jgi:hypothetical protein